jgi:hypothetical protein
MTPMSVRTARSAATPRAVLDRLAVPISESIARDAVMDEGTFSEPLTVGQFGMAAPAQRCGAPMGVPDDLRRRRAQLTGADAGKDAELYAAEPWEALSLDSASLARPSPNVCVTGAVTKRLMSSIR